VNDASNTAQGHPSSTDGAPDQASRERDISTSQLGLLSRWLDTEPEVPEGRWFKRLPEMIVCGEGNLVKTFLIEGQIPTGTEIK
jgi:hypothetical protein